MKSTILAAAALAASMGFAAAAQAQTYYYDQYGRLVSERQLSQDQRRALRAQQRGQLRAQQRAQQIAQAEQARRIREAQLQAQVLGNYGYNGYYGVPSHGMLPCAENLHQPQFSSGSMVPCY